MKEQQLKRRKNFGSSTPTSSPIEQPLNLGDEIPVRGVDCNIPGFCVIKKYKLSKIFSTIV
jgi:hypothetical protein